MVEPSSSIEKPAPIPLPVPAELDTGKLYAPTIVDAATELSNTPRGRRLNEAAQALVGMLAKEGLDTQQGVMDVTEATFIITATNRADHRGLPFNARAHHRARTIAGAMATHAFAKGNTPVAITAVVAAQYHELSTYLFRLPAYAYGTPYDPKYVAPAATQ